MFKYIAIILANVWLPTLEQHFRSTILKFVWLFKLVFPSRRMILTFDIDIDLKTNHP